MAIKIPKVEEKILKFWKENNIFQKSIKQREGSENFVFYEGPPTANGKPGIHHVLTRVFKDMMCRFRTMQGFRVVRKAGWDTHGLPVELQIEKELDFNSKGEIEDYGIAKFNQKCKESVWEYKQDWERLTERIGFWLDLDSPYITYEPDYIETLWWIIKQVHENDLLYKGGEVAPYCPRCGTALSSHEVAQGYKKIKEPSIYVKLPIKSSKFKGFSLLVWTTTPWTLPGNVAVAVHPESTYLKVKSGKEKFILAKERMEETEIEGEVLGKIQGKELVGIEYEPLYPNKEAEENKAYQVIPGGFVSMEEGTGLVHIAPAFGVEDMEAIKDQNRKRKKEGTPLFPILVPVDEEGKFKTDNKDWGGMFVKKADPLIIQDLEEKGSLWKQDVYEHDYPFCWRCKTPLLYYIREGWFIAMRELKDKMIKNNQKINWTPSYLKEGRFGEWLRDMKDWALSRERYWGTPLPVWECSDCDHREVVGGRQDLVKQKYSSNSYLLLRHGHTVNTEDNLKKIYTRKEDSSLGITEQGKKDIKNIIPEIKEAGVDVIFASDFRRTQETAKIIADALDLEVISDKRLRDVDLGVYRGKPQKEFWDNFEDVQERFLKAPEEGESWFDCRKRVLDLIREADQEYEDKTILLIGHGDPLWLLEGAMKGFSQDQLAKQKAEGKTIKPGELRKIKFTWMPFNNKGELDFHRPYIDEVSFECPKCGGAMKRTPEVLDCWFDSGSMPFAQYHYPFENKDLIDEGKQFPADYICEAVDQTRGWFYTLLAVSTLLDKDPAYKNVVSLGHILDDRGEKMSKSKGNIIKPMEVIDKYGVDPVRWYLYSANKPGEPKLFSKKEVGERLKKFILTFWNCFAFFNTYAPEEVGLSCPDKNNLKNVLDKWIVSEFNELVSEVTNLLEEYNITGSSRLIEEFVINKLSLWYIRRSRRRFQDPESEEKLADISQVLGYILFTLTKVSAPFVPFLSEKIYQEIKKKKAQGQEIKQSVHLDDWPASRKDLVEEGLNEKMEKVRKIVTAALAERAKAGIKVRQPLPELQITQKELREEKELLSLIKQELNVKKVSFGEKLKLDTTITPQLREEGMVREAIRHIQHLRKKAGLTPEDLITVNIKSDPEIEKILVEKQDHITQRTRAKELMVSEKMEGEQKKTKIEGKETTFTINKIEE